MLLLLAVAAPMKHLAGWPEGVRVLGPIHGLAFVLYGVALAEAATAGGWSRREIARAALACSVPFGPFLNERWPRRRGDAAAADGRA